jgi:hypothetical protein
MQIFVFVMWGLMGAYGVFHRAPKPTMNYKFTTYEMCPLYQDAHGQTQVEPYVVCPSMEDQKEMAEWKMQEATGKFEGTENLPVVGDEGLVEVAQ